MSRGDRRARLSGPSQLQWTQPSGNFPDVLTFSGAAYTTSGRITALALAPNCWPAGIATFTLQQLAAAFGERTRHLQTNRSRSWTFISGSFATNAIGTLTIDAATVRTRSMLGPASRTPRLIRRPAIGIYKSTDGGDTWIHLAANTSVPAGSGVDCTCAVGTWGMRTAPAYSGPAFDGRARSLRSSSIQHNPNTIYVGSVRAARGISSVLSGGVVTLAPGLPPYGFWKSTDGGANFTLLNYQDACVNPDLPGDAGINPRQVLGRRAASMQSRLTRARRA